MAPYTHTPIPSNTRVRTSRLRARHYQCRRHTAKNICVTSEASSTRHFAILEGALGSGPGKIRSVPFTVEDQLGQQHNFVFFFRNYCKLDINRSIQLRFGHLWRGNIVVLRVAVIGDGLVNLRSSDTDLVDYGVRLLTRQIVLQRTRAPKIPKNPIFQM